MIHQKKLDKNKIQKINLFTFFLIVEFLMLSFEFSRVEIDRWIHMFDKRRIIS